MSNKDRSIHPPPEKPGGEGWLANADQQKIVQFKPDAPTARGVGNPADISLGAGLPNSPVTQRVGKAHPPNGPNSFS